MRGNRSPRGGFAQNGGFATPPHARRPRARLLLLSLFAASAIVASAAAASVSVGGSRGGSDGPQGPSARTPIYGTDRPDVLRGTLGDDLICGLGGNDRIDGLAGNDLIFGGAGNDRVVGGAGRDQVRGGPGNDHVFGVAGNDLLDGERDNDTLEGGVGDDGLTGRDGNDRLYGGNGNDKMGGRAGNDLLRGGGGRDFLSGGAGGDRSFGEGGNDVLHGGPGRDRLSGGAGNDKLEAGGGARNVLLGQQGTDVFEARNGLRDLLNGGPGRDRARVDGVLDVVKLIEAIERDTTALGTGNAGGSAPKPLSAGQSAVCRAPAGNPSRPTALAAKAATPEDTPVTLALAGESPFSTTFTFALTQPPRGAAAIAGSPSCAAAATPAGPWSCSANATYTPIADFYGPDGFSFTVDSREGLSTPAPVTIDVSEVNDPPTTAPDTAAGSESGSLEISAAHVLANDSPGPANETAQTLALQGVSATGETHGKATLVAEKITYAPDAGFFGPATIAYTACDDGTTGGRADPKCADGIIAITVAPNRAPTATEREVGTREDTALDVTLTGDDPDGDSLSFAVTGGPTHGALTGAAPNLTYTPARDFNGADSLTFTVSDGKRTSAAATLRITVAEVNDEPAAEDDEFTVGVSEATVIPPTVVLWNDVAGPVNERGQALEIGAVSETPTTNGTVALADGAIVYTSTPGFSGTATVGYTLCDKGTTTGRPDPRCDADGTVTLFVTPPSRPPVAEPLELETAEDTQRPMALSGSDPDGDPITFRIVDAPDHGTLTGTAPNLVYRPAADYYGPDEFRFVTDDGPLESEPASVELTVTEVNDPPVLGLDMFTVGGARVLPPLPPRPHCGDPCGSVFGDPHVHTYDNGHYAFQAVGEFIAAKSTTDDFEVQVRTKGVEGSREVSLPTAVAMRVAGHQISMYRTLTGYDAYIDGEQTEVPAFPLTLDGGATIGTYGSDYEVFVVSPDGTVVIVAAVGLFEWSYRFSVYVGPASGRLTRLVGLLGDGDDVREDDLRTRDGQAIDFPPYPAAPDFDDLYQLFGHSWRISQAESLFEYGPGETTETFTDLTFPDRPVRPADLPDAVRANATAQCGLFGITDPATLESCVIDVGVTGDVEFAAGAAAAQEATLGIPDNTGVTSIGAATPVAVDTPGARAVRVFTAVAGQRVTLDVAANTIPLADVTVRRPDGSFLTNITVSEETAFLDTFTLPVEGTFTISVDPRDDHTGSLTLSLNPVPENTGSTTIGVPATVLIGTVGESAVRTFRGEEGQKVTLSVNGNTIPVVDLTIRRPDGSFLTNLAMSTETAFLDTFTLPEAGRYSITVDPRLRHLGMLTFALNAVPENTGAAAIGTPATVTIGTVGEDAVRSFTAVAGQKLTLGVSGNTIPVVDLTVRQPDGTFVTQLAVSGATAFLDTFTLPVAGTYTIAIDPREQHTGSVTFSLNPVPENTGSATIGTPATVTIGTIGENAVRTFTAEAGQKVTLSVTGNTIPLVDLTVRRPDGTFVGNLVVSGATGFHEPMTLPVAGTYTVTIDPRGQNTGALTFTLGLVPPSSGETSIGTPTPVTITTPGENSVWAFPATAGRMVTLTVSGNTIPGADLTVRRPDGTFVATLFVSAATGFRDTFTLLVDGTYTLTVDPRVTNTGSLTFTIGGVPANTGETALDQATPVTIGVSGENAVRTFTATAGQLATITVTGNTIPGVDLSINRPNGTFLSSLFLSGANGFRDTFALDVSGAYTITVNPNGQNTGSLTFTIGAVPTNTGTTALGQATPITIGTPGENAVRTFEAAAGQKVSFSVTGNTIPGVDLTIRRPNGSFVGSLFLSGASSFRDTLTLDVAGTYTITIDPSGQNTGTLTFTLHAVPDDTGTTSLGTATPVSIEVPGENAVRSFEAAAGQKVSLAASGNTIRDVDLILRKPDGSHASTLSLFDDATGFRDVVTLPVTGTYTLTVDPGGPDTGALSFTVHAIPDNTGATTLGTATPVTIATPGENAERTFTAAANDLVTLSVSGNTIPGVELDVLSPTGAVVDSLFVFGATGSTNVLTLPANGTYKVAIDPVGANVGSLTFTLVVPEEEGEISFGVPATVTIDAAGGTAARSFVGTANQQVSLTVSGNTIPNAELTVLDPSGSAVDSWFVSGPTGFGDVMTLPADGTYTITVDPFGTGTGAMTFTLHAVPENTGATTIGAATPVTIATPGENAVRSFSGAAGQRLAISVSGNTIGSAQLIVREADGSFVDTFFVFAATGFGEAMTLPSTGTYSVTVDPTQANTGGLTFTLNSVPANTGTTSIGTATEIVIGTPGEEAVRSFEGEAGQRVTLSITDNTITGAEVDVRDPDGEFVGAWFVSQPTDFGDAIELPVDGTYSITINPQAARTGSLTFTLREPVQNTGVTSIGVATPIVIGAPGENAVRSFEAQAGQRVILSVTGNTIPFVSLTVDEPDGSFVGSMFVFDEAETSDEMTLPVAGTYTVTVDPFGDDTGTLTFTLQAVTGGGGIQKRHISASVAGEQIAAASGAVGLAKLELTTSQILANDRPGPANESDQQLTLTAVQANAATHGKVVRAGETITYTPKDGYTGSASFTYTACDDGTTHGDPDPLCEDGTVSLEITTNKVPTAVAQVLETPEDTAVPATLSGADPDGDPVAFAITESPAHGELSGAAPNLTYTPAPNFYGTDSFLYTANDSQDESLPVRVTITVTEVNDPPVAQPNSTTAGVGRTASVSSQALTRNDSAGPFDERAQALTVTGVSSTPDTHGTVSFADDAVVYAPEHGFTGTARVRYTVCDNGRTGGVTDARCADGELSIVPNLAPAASTRSAATQRNTPVTITFGGADPENDPLTFAVASSPAHGTLSGAGDSRTYTPNTGFSGSDTFTFTASDAFSTSAPATVSIEVAETRPPIVRADAAATRTNTDVDIDVLANDEAVDGTLEVTSLAVVTQGTRGTATVVGGKIRYEPSPGVQPDDRFTYRVCDTFGVCGEAEVTVSETVPNRAPAAIVDDYRVDAGTTLDVAKPGVLANDSDPDPGDAIQARLDTGVSAGNLLLRSDGSFRYTPGPGFEGLDSFTYHVVDRAGLSSAPVKVTIDVIPLGPAAIDDSYTTTKNNPLIVMPAGVLANDRDAHTTDILTASVSRSAFRGTLDLNADGSFTYIPEPDFVGTDTFRYIATDVRGVPSAEGFVEIKVLATQCAPPTVTGVAPAEASEVNAPAVVTANIAAPAGETITEWKVTTRNQDRGTPVVLASGTDAPPPTLATFDPTLLVNGPYQILVSAKASGGCTATAVSNVFVSGDMKLGDYQTTFLDMETSIAGFPIQVLRTYDTTDKRRGDFGVGWRVEMTGVRATPNNKLGQGGWYTEPFGFPFTRFRFKTTVPHFVTVTSPGGRVEVFDLVPAPTGPLLSLTTPEYKARAGTGTTSKLEDVDPPTLSSTGLGGSLASFFGGEVYDPSLFRLTTADGDVLIIDRRHGLRSMTDRNDNRVNFWADGVDSPSTGRHLTFERDGAGRITEIRGPEGKRTEYSYSPAGDLRRFVAANGGVDTFSYDANHRLLTVDGPGGKRIRTLNYGPDGRLTSLTDATGNTIALSSDVDARTQIETSPSGRLTTLTKYGADGNLASLEEVFSGRSRITRYEYDAEGRRTKTIAPLDRVETLTYDAAGNVTSRRTPKGELWTFAFNDLNLPTTTTAPDGTVVESNTYDAKGNLTSANLRDGTAATFTNDNRGLPTTTTDSFGTASLAYDVDHQLTAVTDQAGGITRMTYDAAGRLASSENPANEVTQVSWNSLDKPVVITAANGSTQKWTYDTFGRVASSTDSGGRTTTYEYDSEGRLVKSVDRNDRATTYVYDKDGNLVTRTYADGSAEHAVWDPVKRLISLSDPDTIVELGYNEANDRISERSRGNNGVGLPDVTLSYTTDPNGQRTSAAGPGGRIDFTYDSRGRLSSLRDDIGGEFSLAYDTTDRLTGLSRPNGVSDALAYRETHLTQRDASLGGTVVSRAQYTLDALGRRSSLTDLDGVHTFTHDLANRLTGVVHPPASGLSGESFAYDKVGNRTSWVGSPAGSVSYDAGMRLLSDGTYDYTYDGEGRVTLRRNRGTGDVTRYTWNDAGQLTAVATPDGSVSTYGYDAFGRRVEVNDDGVIRRFVYSGWNLRNEFDGANALRATYVAGLFPDRVYEIVRNGTRYYPLFDGVGSVTALTDATGAAVGRVRYSAFGVPQSSGVTEGAVSFTGHQFDSATGLVYARARYYDPTLGRFLSQDPEPAVNPYVYALDAPLEFTDPTGRAALTEDQLNKLAAALQRATRMSQVKAREWAIRIGQKGPDAVQRAWRLINSGRVWEI